MKMKTLMDMEIKTSIHGVEKNVIKEPAIIDMAEVENDQIRNPWYVRLIRALHWKERSVIGMTYYTSVGAKTLDGGDLFFMPKE